jgi:hypothetical protein
MVSRLVWQPPGRPLLVRRATRADFDRRRVFLGQHIAPDGHSASGCAGWTDPEAAAASGNLKNETVVASGRRFLEQSRLSRTMVARHVRPDLEPAREAKPAPGSPRHCSPAGRPCGVMGRIVPQVLERGISGGRCSVDTLPLVGRNQGWGCFGPDIGVPTPPPILLTSNRSTGAICPSGRIGAHQGGGAVPWVG